VSRAAAAALDWVELGLVPDAVIRAAIRRLCARRLREIDAGDCETGARAAEAFLSAMDASDVAPVPQLANEQHYEVPAEFFAIVLGPHRKYSCAWWPNGTDDLAQAEAQALEATCERADLADAQSILELGCGWGSLTLWMGQRFPGARITAVSNSRSQRDSILAEAERRSLSNVEVITADMNGFDTNRRFDRVVSVEMFEHMRNWRVLFDRVHGWLHPGGRFFLHVFCHRSTPYAYVDAGPSDWMSRHFFSGGMMPCDDLALRFQGPLRLRQRWRWSGVHYQRTAEAWLANLDARRAQALPVIAAAYGERHAAQWLQRWRIFFMACAELFGYHEGQEWWVGHYLFERPLC
jgi:cyclopropane-fatty-acyl-phospholipid synthase